MAKAKKKADTTETSAGPLVAFKGFDPDFKCRDMQYEVGKTYKADGRPVRCGSTGFHACDNPFDVWGYYPPVSNNGALNRFAEVSFVGEIDRTGADDTKFAGVEITINAELKLPEFIRRGVEYILSKVDFEGAKETNTGDWSAATNTGNWSAATNTGDWSAATNTGDRSVSTNTGNQSVSTNTGDRSVSTNTGDRSVSTNTGNQSVSTNTGDRSVSTNTGNQSVSTNTGNWSAATNTGDWSAATNTGYRSVSTNTGYRSVSTNTGNWSAATNTGNGSAATNTGDLSVSTVEGKDSVAMASGYEGRVSGADGCALFLVERNDDYEIVAAWAGIVGRDGIKPGVFYTLRGGQPVEA